MQINSIHEPKNQSQIKQHHRPSMQIVHALRLERMHQLRNKAECRQASRSVANKFKEAHTSNLQSEIENLKYSESLFRKEVQAHARTDRNHDVAHVLRLHLLGKERTVVSAEHRTN